jgi:hypothetical protein
MTRKGYLLGLVAALSACSQTFPESDDPEETKEIQTTRESQMPEEANVPEQMTDEKREALLHRQMEPVMSSSDRDRLISEQMKPLARSTTKPG